MARDLELNDAGFHWFPFGGVAGRSYFPTDGLGGQGNTATGDASTDSHLRGFNSWRIVRYVLTRGATGSLFIEVPPAGTDVAEFVHRITDSPAGLSVCLNYRANGDNGFSIRCSNSNLQGICIYERFYKGV